MMPRFTFGAYELQTDSGELLRDGERVPLQHQPAELLGLLAERAGAVVSRDEIRDRIWGSETYVDSEQGINYCIRQIRQALRDEAATPRYVETIPRRGYRFLAPVEVGDAPATVGEGARGRRGGRIAVLGLILSGALVAAVALRLSESAQGEAAAPPAAVPPAPLVVPEEAHARFLEARYLLARAPEGDLVSDARRATELLLAVVEEVPDHAEAHAALAEAWLLRLDLPRAEAMANAEQAARRALDLAPGLADAQVALSSTLFFHRLDWEGARASLERALEIDPSSPEAVFLNGVILSALGRHEEGIAAARRAARLDPSQLPGISIAWLYYFARRYDRAVEEAERILELQPLDEPSHGVLVLAHLARGDEAAADRELDRHLRLLMAVSAEEDLDLPPIREYYGMFWTSRERALSEGYSLTYIAAFGALAGARKEAIAYLRQACEERSAAWDLPFLAVDPRWDRLRADPAFDEVVDCVGVPGFARRVPALPPPRD